jgi:D-glycero-alpha-D-manno-heptose-7-phosphate kinase
MDKEMLRARAPLRISFAGGMSDIPSYYMEQGGAVLAGTINRYTYVTLSPREEDDTEVNIRSLDFDTVVRYRLEEGPVYDGVLDLVKAAITRMIPRDRAQGFDVCIESDAPAGSGLGGSSSLTLAVIGVLAEFMGLRLDLYQQAELAYTIERIDLGISGGKQDQYEISFGGFNWIEFSKEGVVVNPLRLDRDLLNELECHLMLCYTGGTRPSAGIVDRQQEYYREGRPQTLEGLKRIHQLAYEMKDALLTGRLKDFGEMLHLEWENKVKANPTVTTDWIDDMYALARSSGVIGGKLLGAGGGGYLLFFSEIEKKRSVRQRLEEIGGQFVNFSFLNEGLQVWRSTCP